MNKSKATISQEYKKGRLRVAQMVFEKHRFNKSKPIKIGAWVEVNESCLKREVILKSFGMSAPEPFEFVVSFPSLIPVHDRYTLIPLAKE